MKRLAVWPDFLVGVLEYFGNPPGSWRFPLCTLFPAITDGLE